MPDPAPQPQIPQGCPVPAVLFQAASAQASSSYSWDHSQLKLSPDPVSVFLSSFT